MPWNQAEAIGRLSWKPGLGRTTTSTHHVFPCIFNCLSMKENATWYLSKRDGYSPIDCRIELCSFILRWHLHIPKILERFIFHYNLLLLCSINGLMMSLNKCKLINNLIDYLRHWICPERLKVFLHIFHVLFGLKRLRWLQTRNPFVTYLPLNERSVPSISVLTYPLTINEKWTYSEIWKYLIGKWAF